jgi:hypothetical protein
LELQCYKDINVIVEHIFLLDIGEAIVDVRDNYNAAFGIPAGSTIRVYLNPFTDGKEFQLKLLNETWVRDCREYVATIRTIGNQLISHLVRDQSFKLLYANPILFNYPFHA